MERPRDRSLDRFALAAWVVYALLCWFVWPEDAWRPEWDSATYLLTGTSLAEGDGYRYLGEPFFLRPPGTAFLISFFVEDGRVDIPALLRVLVLTGALFVGAVYAAVRCVASAALAFAVAVLTATSPLLATTFNTVMSELPFAACLFGAIACLERVPRSERGRWAWVAGGAALWAGAAWFRTVALVLPPGMLLPLLGPSRRRRAATCGVTFGLSLALIAP